ncbi:MAG TPA: hypothetical protein VNU72_03920, partial [Puia sp.]|nr:hypothetical protein [Puia sp.]
KNGAGGFIAPLRYDLFQSPNSSFSLGFNPAAGTEDRYGIGFPLTLAFIYGGGNGNDFPDLRNFADSSAKGTVICFFAQAPLLLQYNWGLGSGSGDRYSKRVGFYAGGGMGLTVTGVTNNLGNEHSESFWGWVGTFGLRFAKNKDLGFELTLPCQKMIGPIPHPVMYQVHFCWDLKSK